MDTRHLTDAIVRQTTLLIAQLATSGGIRAPLAHIADEVFLDLANEIESQGVSRNVVADMFGLALRTYQKKVNRVRESMTQTETTLWESVLRYVREQGGTTRSQILERFARDDERHVVAVLGDLVSSGLLYNTGRGRHAAYGPVPERQLRALVEEEGIAQLAHVIWLEIASNPNLTRLELVNRFPTRVHLLDQALESLLSDGRIQVDAGRELACFRTAQVFIPAQSEAGWEAAVLDHFRAVCVAIASKLRLEPRSDKRDLIGGSTLRFELSAEHPLESEVLNLLRDFRTKAFDLWSRVSTHNQGHPPAADDRRHIIIYFGQNIVDPTLEQDTKS